MITKGPGWHIKRMAIKTDMLAALDLFGKGIDDLTISGGGAIFVTTRR